MPELARGPTLLRWKAKGGLRMRNLLLQFGITLAVALMLLLAVGSTPSTTGAQPDVAAINKILELYAKGVNTGDAALWGSLWDNKGIRMPPDAPAVLGKAQIRAGAEGRFAQFNSQIAITNEETWVFGNLAFARGTFTLSRTPKAGGETAFYDGKYLTVFRKQADGSWEIFRDIWNSNLPPK